MDKATYVDIRHQLDFDKPAWMIGAVLAFEVLFFWCIIWLLQQPSWPAYIASQLLLVIFFFHAFALLHECGHGNIHQKRWVNVWLGHLFSIFCTLPFFSWKYIHQQHHTGIGYLDKDPTLRAARKARETQKVPLVFSLAWKYWFPLIILMQIFTLWTFPLRHALEVKKIDRWSRNSAFSVLFLTVSYVVLFRLFGDFITARNFLPGFILNLMFVEYINLPHHLETPLYYSTPQKDHFNLWEQHSVSRSCYYPGFVELCTLNFDLHTEHHYFPTLPWYRLKKVRQLIAPKLGKEYNDIGITWYFKARRKDLKKILLAT